MDAAAVSKVTSLWVHSPECTLGGFGDLHPHPYECLIGTQRLCLCIRYIPVDGSGAAGTGLHGIHAHPCASKARPCTGHTCIYLV